MQRIVLAFSLLLCACTDAVHENPQVTNEVTSSCGPSKRLVTDVCTELGGDDGCVAVDDVCIALCDGLTSCTTVSSMLRPLTGWPTAPDGYCVVCDVP
jgi:hypothetical protein